MESYPERLLVGASPLVFCIDTTLSGNEEDASSTSRSQFDKLLDTISASSSLVNDGDDIHESGPMMQRVEEEQSDNEDEALLNSTASAVGGSESGIFARNFRRLRNSSGSLPEGAPASPRADQYEDRRVSFTGTRSPIMRTLNRMGSRRNTSSSSIGGDGTGSEAGGNNSSQSLGIDVSPAFSEALQQGQSFFQRARFIPISARHGFPPSKDPTGGSNRVVALTGLLPGQYEQPPRPSQHQQHQQTKRSRVHSATQKRPIDGILPSGWLEKHAAALPSVIVVVAQIHPPHQQSQQRQDDLLVETLENLQHSLALKRKLDIKVVALVQEGVSPILADQWSQGILGRLPSFIQDDNNNNPSTVEPENLVTLVYARELRSVDQSDAPAGVDTSNLNDGSTEGSSFALPKLNHSIRKSSLRYYKDRSRAVKDKLLRLGGPQAAINLSPALFPLMVRYCFKAAVFYEFQWKQEKTLKYMVEAYRLVEAYFRYLLMRAQHEDDDNQYVDELDKKRTVDKDLELPPMPSLSEISTTPSAPSREEVFDCGEGVEMSLPSTTTVASTTTTTSSGDDYYSMGPLPDIAEDMVDQCRAVADWLNFKILQMCLVSHDKSGIIAASLQWQRHVRAFCCPRRSFLHRPIAPWLDWSYMSQQLIVVSQLLERYPPRSLGKLGAAGAENHDEDLLRCCPWRTFEAASEALLKTGHRIRLVMKQGGLSSIPLGKEPENGAVRIRYVGGIDHEGFRPKFEEESKKNHMELALDHAFRGIALYGKEAEQLKKSNVLTPWTRSGARLHYLAGGALLGLNRYSEAIPHLEKAVGLCKGWNYLESLVQRLLVECYEKQGVESTASTDGEGDSRVTRTSSLLDCYFGAKLSAKELNCSIEKLAKRNDLDTFESDGDKYLRWNWSCIDDEIGGTAVQPFSFALTFPGCTHATLGEKVKAHVWIKSNLGYSVCVNRLSLLTFLGSFTTSSEEFPSASKHSSGDKATMIVKPNEEIEFVTDIMLPMDLNPVPTNGTGSAVVESSASAPKTTMAKKVSPKLNTGGCTAGGGTRFIQEDDTDSPGATSFMDLCLGGKPLRCEGITISFFPLVLSTGIKEGNKTRIELTLQLVEPKPPPNVKRSLFDDNNYLSSAWKRPMSLCMSRGPRCLRLLPPAANMTVTNVTDEFTNGKALEGTVNRIVLKLKPGKDEVCSQVMIRFTCSSFLTTTDGEAKRISLKESNDTTEDGEEIESTINPRVRAPALVKRDIRSEKIMSNFGYTLPDGWTTFGDGQSGADDHNIIASKLNAGEETYAYFDLYRPLINPITALARGNGDTVEEIRKYDSSICETKVDISIRYHQEGNDNANMTPNGNVERDFVSLEHSVNVLWTSPISVAFSSTAQDAYPCGNRHTSNLLSDLDGTVLTDNRHNSALPEKNETVLIDKERVFTKGIIEATAAIDGLFVEVEKVRFVANEKNGGGKFKLLSSDDVEGTIYEGEADHPCRTLSVGSEMSFAWITGVNMESEFGEESFVAPIGTILVDWRPSPIKVPKDVQFLAEDDLKGSHGPLQLQRSAPYHFIGPRCYVESAPFKAKPENLPDLIEVAVPFQVTYSIRNNTPLDQDLEIMLQDSQSPGDDANDAFLISGLVNQKLSIGPYESHLFSYTAIPMKVGRVNLPPISISSGRYGTWIVRESLQKRLIYVTP